jgi:hypothetical protein
MVGMGATVVGLQVRRSRCPLAHRRRGCANAKAPCQATTGLLFAKTLSVAASNPYLSGSAFNPVAALDVFLVQAAANTLLSHFIGAAISLWLLRSVTQP